MRSMRVILSKDLKWAVEFITSVMEINSWGSDNLAKNKVREAFSLAMDLCLKANELITLQQEMALSNISMAMSFKVD